MVVAAGRPLDRKGRMGLVIDKPSVLRVFGPGGSNLMQRGKSVRLAHFLPEHGYHASRSRTP
jgi:hypothetical protein